MHIPPLEAELLDIGEVDPELREKGAAWLGPEDIARKLGLKASWRPGRQGGLKNSFQGLLAWTTFATQGVH